MLNEKRKLRIDEPFYFPNEISVPGVLKLLDTDKKIVIFYGWRDGGKSTSLAKILISKLLFDPHFRGVHVRKHYNEIATSTFQNLIDQVKWFGVNKYVNITKDHFQLTNALRTNNFLFGAGADNPDKIRSTQDLNVVWFEEFHDATQRDFESIMGTIREKKGFDTKFIATLNNDKVPVDGFLHNTFFKESSPIWNDIELVHVSWRDNPFIDHAATEKKLRLITLNNEDRFRILDSGGFIPESQGEYYTEFRDYNVVDHIELDPAYPLLVSFDFNYDPCSLVICQNVMRRGGGFHVVKELQAVGGTRPLVRELQAYLKHIDWNGTMKITGDASGHKHDTRSGAITDFQIIQSEMKIPTGWMNYQNKTNMALGMSRDLIDAGFYHQVIKISKKGCPGLINDIRIAKPANDGSFVKDRDTYKMDLLDAFRYAFHHEFKDIRDIDVKKSIYG